MSIFCCWIEDVYVAWKLKTSQGFITKWAQKPIINGSMGLFHPSYSVIRKIIWVITPFIHGSGPPCTVIEIVDGWERAKKEPRL